MCIHCLCHLPPLFLNSWGAGVKSFHKENLPDYSLVQKNGDKKMLSKILTHRETEKLFTSTSYGFLRNHAI
jgi:hypothetical protein